MQIAGKDVKNLLMNKVLYSWIRCLKKKTLKKTNRPKRHLFIFLLENGLNIFQFGIVQVMIITMTYNS